MLDRYDPKSAARSASDGRPGEANQGPSAAKSDPLVELARIVSGRTGGAAARARTMPAAPQPAPDVVDDLEAELLSDLQASFTVVKGSRSSSATARTPAPQAAPAPQSAAPVQRAERMVEVPPPPPPLVAKMERPRVVAPAERAPSEAPTSPATGAVPTATAGAVKLTKEMLPTRGPMAQRTEAPAPPPAAARAAPQPTPETEAPPAAKRSTEPAERIDLPNLRLRATTSPAPVVRSRQPHRRWDKPVEPAKAASRFAPPRVVPPPPAAAPPAQDELLAAPTFSEAAGSVEPEVELPFDDFELVPGYGDEDQPPPDGGEELNRLVKQRSSGRRFGALAVVVAVVAVAGGAYLLLRGGSSENIPPPIITANGAADQDHAARRRHVRDGPEQADLRPRRFRR